MKTPEQIKEYLQKQEWYPLFVENLLKSNFSKNVIMDFISGNYKEWTISAARMLFTENGKYWKDIERKFLWWYLGVSDNKIKNIFKAILTTFALIAACTGFQALILITPIWWLQIIIGIILIVAIFTYVYGMIIKEEKK